MEENLDLVEVIDPKTETRYVAGRGDFLFFRENAKEFYSQTDKGSIVWGSSNAGLDLYCCEDTIINPGEIKLIPLGICVKPPAGFYFEIVPRSSTFKNFGLLQANSVGVIDASYCGDEDELKWAAYNPGNEPKTIKAGERPCQMLQRHFFAVVLDKREVSIKENRGGFGTTGR